MTMKLSVLAQTQRPLCRIVGGSLICGAMATGAWALHSTRPICGAELVVTQTAEPPNDTQSVAPGPSRDIKLGTRLYSQLTEAEKKPLVGDAPADPGPLARMSPVMKMPQVRTAIRKVADWQTARIESSPSQDWTFATLYVGMLAASQTLGTPRYHDVVLNVANHFDWRLGPRKLHADDQAIGQAYLWLYNEKRDANRVAPLEAQFDEVMKVPDDPNKPVWWWCDALFMAPPVWSGLAQVTGNQNYLAYMHRQWKITSHLLWDPKEHLFSRDHAYLTKYEKNGRKLFWSRGNGWVMGGIVRVLETLPTNDPRRGFYEQRLRQMAASVAGVQSKDGLWRAGLLDPDAYPNPEVSGSAFFIYAMAWGVNHRLLDENTYLPVIRRGWSGLVGQIYADGRLGNVQPVGEAPGAYRPASSYVFGVGAFLLAGAEVDRLVSNDSDQANQSAHRVGVTTPELDRTRFIKGSSVLPRRNSPHFSPPAQNSMTTSKAVGGRNVSYFE